MNFQVMNKRDAVKYSCRTHTERSAIISIVNLFDSPVNFSHQANIKYILNLSFDDVEDGDKSISWEDGQKIRNFVNKCIRSNIELLIVHCEGGVSRSAGVCAAIMKAVTGDDMDIFSDPHFCPNMTCYRTVLNALMCNVDEEEIQNKFHLNIEKWRELNDF